MSWQVTRVQLYHDEIGRMMELPQVRGALVVQANRIAAAAKGLAGSGEVADTIFVEDGTRPKGRPFARAVSDPGRFSQRMPGKRDRRAILQQAADLPIR